MPAGEGEEISPLRWMTALIKGPGTKERKGGVILSVVAVILALDQLTKFAVSNVLELNNPVCVIKGIFCFTLVHNRGAAFGILQNQTSLFIATSLIAIVLIYFNIRKTADAGGWYNIALGSILAGAIGNLIDRLIFGYVIDFLLGWQVLFKVKSKK
jgi:signal peptidase II